MEELEIENAKKLIKAYAWFWGNQLQRWRSLIEEEYGTEVAVDLESKIAPAVGKSMAKKITDILGNLEGIEGFTKALQFTPEHLIEDFEVVKRTQKELIIQNSHCTVQKARRKRGKSEYPCKTGAFSLMKNFASEIDTRLELRCVCCPPDENPSDISCKWKFKLLD